VSGPRVMPVGASAVVPSDMEPEEDGLTEEPMAGGTAATESSVTPFAALSRTVSAMTTNTD